MSGSVGRRPLQRRQKTQNAHSFHSGHGCASCGDVPLIAQAVELPSLMWTEFEQNRHRLAFRWLRGDGDLPGAEGFGPRPKRRLPRLHPSRGRGADFHQRKSPDEHGGSWSELQLDTTTSKTYRTSPPQTPSCT